eukprot:TRINITY_DN51353_c0_g1_i1.p2 TRINITY_DN51353_c0_g1~~TRINITY_DN51353_c0_g1_i1.p2  ORF type:complete len:219 (-),score=20.46 TRINITY_DN51353_c0_g1_i1:890-1546(-)
MPRVLYDEYGCNHSQLGSPWIHVPSPRPPEACYRTRSRSRGRSHKKRSSSKRHKDYSSDHVYVHVPNPLNQTTYTSENDTDYFSADSHSASFFPAEKDKHHKRRKETWETEIEEFGTDEERRQLRQARKTLKQLRRLKRELVRLERCVAAVQSEDVDEIARCYGLAENLLTQKIDAVETSELQFHQESARQDRRQLVQRCSTLMDQLIELKGDGSMAK